MKRVFHLLAAMAVASLAAPAVVAVTVIPQGGVKVALEMFMIAWMVAVAGLVVLGLPLVLLLRRRLGWTAVLLAGCLAGAGLSVVTVQMYVGGSTAYPAIAWSAYASDCARWGALGALTSAVLWRTLLLLERGATGA